MGLGKKAGMAKSLLAKVLVELARGPVSGSGGVWRDRSSVFGGVGGPGAVAGSPVACVNRVTVAGAVWQVKEGEGGGGNSLTVVTADVVTLASSAPSGSTSGHGERGRPRGRQAHDVGKALERRRRVTACRRCLQGESSRWPAVGSDWPATDRTGPGSGCTAPAGQSADRQLAPPGCHRTRRPAAAISAVRLGSWSSPVTHPVMS